MVIWASIFHLGAYAVHFMTPVATGAWRFVSASVFLIPIVALGEGWNWPALKRNAPALLAMALAGIFIFNAAMFYGLKSTSALNATLIMALSPAMTTVMNALLQRRPVPALQWLGLACGIAGVAFVVTRGSLHTLLTLQLSRGDALMLLASVSWSVFSIIPSRYVHGLSALQMSGAAILIGAALLAALALSQDIHSMAIPTLPLALALFYMGLIGTVLALTWWNQSIQVLGPTQATLFMNLVPVSGAIMSVFLGQSLIWAHFVGAALVLTGVSIAVLQNR